MYSQLNHIIAREHVNGLRRAAERQRLVAEARTALIPADAERRSRRARILRAVSRRVQTA